MSYDVFNTWFYQIHGRDLHLYQITGLTSSMPDQLGRFRLRGELYTYPDEDITDGLMVEYGVVDSVYINEPLEDLGARASGTTISFSGSVITDSDSGFGDFADGDKIRVRGSSDNDGDYTVTTAASGSLTCSATTFTTESASESITVFQIPAEDSSPSETSHINADKLTCLAIVDYLIAKKFENVDERQSLLNMKRFYTKIGKSMLNRAKTGRSIPKYPFAVR